MRSDGVKDVFKLMISLTSSLTGLNFRIGNGLDHLIPASFNGYPKV